MKKRRPTISLGDWMLAVDLETSRKIQNQKEMPANECDCDECRHLKLALDQVFPKDIKEQLIGIGINPMNPTDFIKYDVSEKEESVRVIYHVIGKILSGPNPYRVEKFGETLIYHPVRDQPRMSMVVVPQKQAYGYAPILDDDSAGMLICIDFRLVIPGK